ncbi:hypothetical protein [Kineosporia babensis]|uniref:Uncharacterized protein n=1 Tax=Kineosporia babensis TaxID=499548 RepID=A0A9X1N9A4_9ACTN|nr:hypothetical protein [Kineosporia babensis]MCD5310907.1 hypothetical protein [Kineosporia babensis]
MTSDILEALDAVLADHEATSEELCQQYFTEAMAGVRDALDGDVSSPWREGASWRAPEKPARSLDWGQTGWIEVGYTQESTIVPPFEWAGLVERLANAVHLAVPVEAEHPLLMGADVRDFTASDPLGGLLDVVEPSVVHRRTVALEARPPVMPATRIPQRGSVYSLPVQQRRRR